MIYFVTVERGMNKELIATDFDSVLYFSWAGFGSNQFLALQKK